MGLSKRTRPRRFCVRGYPDRSCHEGCQHDGEGEKVAHETSSRRDVADASVEELPAGCGDPIAGDLSFSDKSKLRR